MKKEEGKKSGKRGGGLESGERDSSWVWTKDGQTSVDNIKGI